MRCAALLHHGEIQGDVSVQHGQVRVDGRDQSDNLTGKREGLAGLLGPGKP